MIQAILIPALVASITFGGGAAQKRAGDYQASFTAPELFIQNEPYRVTVDFLAVGEKPCQMPVWLMTPAAWLVNNKPLTRREAEGNVELQPGQKLSVSLDLSGFLTERFEGDPIDFRLSFAETGVDPKDVIYLGLPERGINFEELPKEQLGNYQVVLQTTGGPIWLEMWPDVAPNHVRNFLDLASKGFYDGSGFHRVIPTFMVQGGKAASGEVAPRKLDAEFNSRKHEAGVLSAARLPNDINSATSEFFIVHRKSSGLDGKYSAFGQVIIGMDAVESIVKGVEGNYSLINRLAANQVRMDSQNALFQQEMNRPNPPQMITQALVVKASKSRPSSK
ncbi:Peptidyl-prolyl cis-trans isomerase B [Planctomycetes bacterium Poly30]|uniref:peptidylprolyl isomerase n=1 Tax=Saltatorellus ferox TaxID=2528018 RepID=A0A518EY07_9BACT|nr:Peptidyl-prolyl cis-trans isomerase B [Planctomycetes bacterium Poly30]